MKLVLIIAFFTVSYAFADSLKSSENIANKQVITSEEIKSAGVINLSDIYNLIDKVNYTTIDGIQNFTSVSSLTNYSRQNYIFFIDGQKFETNIFDVNDINLLPISIDQVDSVVVLYIPNIVNGVYSKKGVIHLYTKDPQLGFSINAAYVVANESGDPGPYKFTEYETPNVDKLNYINTFSLMGAGENWSLKGNLKLEENYITDPAIVRRISSLSPNNNKADLQSGSLQFNYSLLGREHQIFGGYSTRNDFFYFKPYGNEIPVKRIVSHAGFNGGFHLSNSIQLNYNFIISKNEMGESLNKQNLKFDFGLNNYFGNLEGLYSNKILNWKFGLNYNEYIATGSSTITNSKLLFTELYSNLNMILTDNFNQSIGVMLKKLSDASSLKFNFRSAWEINKTNLLELSFNYDESMYEEDFNFWNWIMKGYNSNIVEIIDYIEIGTPDKSNKVTIDLQYLNKNRYNDFSIGIGYRDYNNIYIENQKFMYKSKTSSLYSPVVINYNGRQKYLNINSGIEFLLFDSVKNKIFYNYHYQINNNNNDENVIPEHNIKYSINFKPVEGFGLWASIRYISATTWSEFRYINRQSNDKYSNQISSKLLFDFSVEKWFWNKKIWTNLLFRNLTNTEERYHPIGTSLDLRFVFQLHLYFNTLFQ